jgi:hypothetical protein
MMTIRARWLRDGFAAATPGIGDFNNDLTTSNAW